MNTKDIFSSPKLDEHATAIGWTCILMADLEAMVGRIVTHLANINDLEPRNIIEGSTSLTDKVKMAKG
jgi:hypothetical protein